MIFSSELLGFTDWEDALLRHKATNIARLICEFISYGILMELLFRDQSNNRTNRAWERNNRGEYSGPYFASTQPGNRNHSCESCIDHAPWRPWALDGFGSVVALGREGNEKPCLYWSIVVPGRRVTLQTEPSFTESLYEKRCPCWSSQNYLKHNLNIRVLISSSS